MANRLQAVIDALVTALAAPTSGTVYEPDLVLAVLFWPDEEAVQKSGKRTVYFIRQGRQTDGLPDSGTITTTVEVYILAAHWLGTEPPQLLQTDLVETEARWKVSTELVADVAQKLLAAENDTAGKLGGTAGVVTLFAGPLEWDHERPSETGQWVVPELRTLVRFRREHADR